MTITTNRDSLMAHLTQSSQDLCFDWPLCGHNSKYYIMVYLEHIPAVSVLYKAEVAAWATLIVLCQLNIVYTPAHCTSLT